MQLGKGRGRSDRMLSRRYVDWRLGGMSFWAEVGWNERQYGKVRGGNKRERQLTKVPSIAERPIQSKTVFLDSASLSKCTKDIDNPKKNSD